LDTINPDWQTKSQVGLPRIVVCPETIAVKHTAIIAAAGFEDRTMALVSALTQEDCALGLLFYKDWEDNNRDRDLLAAYGRKGIGGRTATVLDYDRFDPDRLGGSLRDWLKGIDTHQVLLDISTMSRLAIMVVLDACREANKSVTVFYAEAEQYGPTEEEFLRARSGIYPRPSIQVYGGLGGIVRSQRLSSVALQGEPTALIAFMSMNELLTQALINGISPSRLFLINGRPPQHSWREAATAWIHEELRREWPERDNPCHTTEDGATLPQRTTSTLDYSETADTLLGLYWGNAAHYRVVLAPTGSKMQTVGCYIAKGIHTDIHIEYPTPESFLPAYSKGIGTRWMVEFGVLSTLLSDLRATIMADRLMVLRAGVE
jgi:hypothetical protein